MAERLVFRGGRRLPEPPLPPEIEKAFREYSAAVGDAIIALSELQDEFGIAFSMILGDLKIGLTLWRSIPYDATQRRMLRALIASRGPEDRVGVENMNWALREADRLAGSRNLGAHAAIVHVLDGGTGRLGASPFGRTGNVKKWTEGGGTGLFRKVAADCKALRPFVTEVAAFQLAKTGPLALLHVDVPRPSLATAEAPRPKTHKKIRRKKARGQ